MTQTTASKNIYGGYCTLCHVWVPERAGQVERISGGRWVVSHLPGGCAAAAAKAAAKKLVPASTPAVTQAPRQSRPVDTYCEECGAAVPNGRQCPVCGETEMLRHND